MALRTLLGLVLPLIFACPIWAENIKVNPNHPDQYTVVRGDTLWDISGKFLQHPWQWPALWGSNPQIKNPHLIYPGDTLYFSYVDGEPRLSLSRHENSSEAGGDVKLSPQIRESDNQQAVKLITNEAIAPFLTSPKVVGKNELERAPYVLEIAGEHVIAGAGDRLYVRGIGEPPGLGYTVYRPGKPYIDPDSKEILGYEAKYIADATLLTAADPATMIINKSDSEIYRGDRLIPDEANQLALNYFPRPPQNKVVGHIIGVLNGVSQIGRNMVVVIDRGSADGLEPGHTLEIYQRGRMVLDRYQTESKDPIKLPDEQAGVLMIFRPFERVSYALVIETHEVVHVLDRVQTH